jgi:hypothetical protein
MGRYDRFRLAAISADLPTGGIGDTHSSTDIVAVFVSSLLSHISSSANEQEVAIKQ